ncbi:hypothetical protein Tco_1374680 [Tanacetum coccineum]
MQKSSSTVRHKIINFQQQNNRIAGLELHQHITFSLQSKAYGGYRTSNIIEINFQEIYVMACHSFSISIVNYKKAYMLTMGMMVMDGEEGGGERWAGECFAVEELMAGGEGEHLEKKDK